MCGPIVKGKKEKKGRGKKGDRGGGGKTKYFNESSFHEFIFFVGERIKR